QSRRPPPRPPPTTTPPTALPAGSGKRPFPPPPPPHFSSQRSYPLVILLHGHNNNGASVLHQTKMDAVADRYGYILAAPNGTGRFGRFGLTWNVGTCCGSAEAKHVDDVGFLAALVDTLTHTLPIDTGRVLKIGR